MIIDLLKVLILLNDLRVICDPSQVELVDRLIAKAYVSKGMIEMRSGDSLAAKISFQTALRLTHYSNRPSFAQFLKADIRIKLALSHAEIGDVQKSEQYLDITAKLLNRFKFSTNPSVIAYNITSSLSQYNGEVAFQKQSYHLMINSNKKMSLSTWLFSEIEAKRKTFDLADSTYFKRIITDCGLAYLRIKKYDKAYGLLVKSLSHSSPIELEVVKQVATALKVVNSKKNGGLKEIEQRVDN